MVVYWSLECSALWNCCPLFSRKRFYRPPTMLREGNVLSLVCLSRQGGYCAGPCPQPSARTCSNLFTEARTVDKWAVCIRLKCLLLLTVRNEVAKVMFLQESVCPWGVSASVHAGIPHPPGADTPL